MDPVGTARSKTRIATVWLGGCSGCHMSFLDLDERLLDLASQVELCYSPIADVKEFPEVDIALVEGSVANRDHVREIRHIRQKARILVAFGDCAVTANVTAMRNSIPLAEVLETSYGAPDFGATAGILPVLLERTRPLHELVPVDHFLPGCPPAADKIYDLITSLLAGQPAAAEKRFG